MAEEKEVVPVEAAEPPVVDPATIIPEPAIVPTGFVEINSIQEAIVERLALEHAFLDRLQKDFYSKTKLTPKQQRQRNAAKRARKARRVQRRRAR